MVSYIMVILIADSQDAPKRSLAIAKELGVLSTNIPTAWGSSIFLRVDDNRVDCIKAMIIGPQDTPYENGCFLFDIFLPLEYNQRCPSVKSMTTNGGKYRYNPNLYPDGVSSCTKGTETDNQKVCLSLLGTWSGPGWIAGKSTLLQVLISIQSLILCEEPYLNEPGWAGQSGVSEGV
jgi:ubiquitin-protein ligase